MPVGHKLRRSLCVMLCVVVLGAAFSMTAIAEELEGEYVDEDGIVWYPGDKVPHDWQETERAALEVVPSIAAETDEAPDSDSLTLGESGPSEPPQPETPEQPADLQRIADILQGIEIAAGIGAGATLYQCFRRRF